jgi:putative membrane protein
VRKTLVLAAVAAAVASLPAAAASPSLSAWDKQWLMTSISGDRFEVAGGKLAQQKTQTPAVKALADRLVADHSKSLTESIALAQKLGVKVPSAPTPSMQWELKAVAAVTDFDRWYSSLETQDHLQDIAEATAESAEGTNPEVRAAAKQELPLLKEHLALARKAQAASP